MATTSRLATPKSVHPPAFCLRPAHQRIPLPFSFSPVSHPPSQRGSLSLSRRPQLASLFDFPLLRRKSVFFILVSPFPIHPACPGYPSLERPRAAFPPLPATHRGRALSCSPPAPPVLGTITNLTLRLSGHWPFRFPARVVASQSQRRALFSSSSLFFFLSFFSPNACSCYARAALFPLCRRASSLFPYFADPSPQTQDRIDGFAQSRSGSLPIIPDRQRRSSVLFSKRAPRERLSVQNRQDGLRNERRGEGGPGPQRGD